MGETDLRAETREKVKKEAVTKIHGQPTHTDITKLEEELVQIAIVIPTSLGGGELGHAGLIIEPTEYEKHSNGVPFTRPSQPPTLPPTAQADDKRNVERIHNEKIRIFNLYLGVEQGLRDKIIEAIDEEFLLELRQGVLGYQKVTARQMINHLRKRGGGLDHVDVMKIRKERDEPWDCTENPAAYFARVEKNVHLLSLVAPTPIVTDMTERMMAVLSALTESGIFNVAVREWEQKPENQKTWDNIKVFTCEEYTKAQRRGSLTARQAGFGAANALQEAITDVTKDQANLATNVVDALKEMKLTIEELKKKVDQNPTANNAAPTTQSGSGKSYAERKAERMKRLKDAPICKHCNRKHPSQPEDKCWELDANAATRPTGWTSRKAASN
jgi:hypothetical protein